MEAVMRPILLAILITAITAIPAFAGTRLENRPDGQYVIVERVDSVGHVYGITEQKLDPENGTILCVLTDDDFTDPHSTE